MNHNIIKLTKTIIVLRGTVFILYNHDWKILIIEEKLFTGTSNNHGDMIYNL